MTNQEIKAVLERALARLRGGDAWTKGAFARDRHGVMVDPKSKHAQSWCAIGAVYAEIPEPFDDFKEITAPLRKGHGPATVNDMAGSFRTVEEMYQRAIASLGDT